jgi:NAD(P)-dependent dehydrogenase (short-subunit alcohol dehydrogenase family)
MDSVWQKFDLKGRAAIVTGGAGLLGKQFCETLALAGAAVIVADANVSIADAVAEDLRQRGFSASAIAVDVTSPELVRKMVEGTLRSYGRLDILVNSAAIDPKYDHSLPVDRGCAFEDYPLAAWRQALDVNLTGMFLCCQAVTRQMRGQGSGSIINICSIYGLVGPDQRIYQLPGEEAQNKPADYSVTKAGVLGLTRYLATYFAGQNIRVNALTPGGVYHDHDPEFVRNYSARTVLGRMAHADEMSGALLFLASDASSYMTGANLVIDGGWTAW